MSKITGNKNVERYFYFFVLVVTGILLLPPVFRRFSCCGIRWVYILTVSAAISFSLTPLCIRLARRFNALDIPDERKKHDHATPLFGGAAIFLAFLAAIFINGILNRVIGGILGAALLVFVVGLADDVKGVSAIVKLLTQIVAVTIVVSHGVVLRVVPAQLGLFSQLTNLGLTFMWIVGITNAMNFFDGMNGLAAGLGAMIAFFLTVVAYQTGQPFVGWIGVAVMGSCLGFLPYNFRTKGKAFIFLGDAGSTFIGFILACIAVYGIWSVDNPVVALVSPVLIFWVLIFDMFYITIDRIAAGKVASLRQWLEYVGRDHLHHRLAAVLDSNVKSVLFILVLNGCLGISAVVLRHAGLLEAVLLLVQALLLVLMISSLERYGRFFEKK